MSIPSRKTDNFADNRQPRRSPATRSLRRWNPRILILLALITVSVSSFGLESDVADKPYQPTFSEWVGGWIYDLGVWATVNILPGYGVAGSDPYIEDGETYFYIYIVHNPEPAAAEMAQYTRGLLQDLIAEKVLYWQGLGYPIESGDFVFQIMPREGKAE